MKIWIGFGSEHSMNLVLIGRFESPARLDAAVETMGRLRELAEAEWPEDSWERTEERMTGTLMQALWDLGLNDMGRWDVDIFAYEHDIETNGSEIRITTEESEIQGFLKVLLHLGARIEIYSAHSWNDDGTPKNSTDADTPPAAE